MRTNLCYVSIFIFLTVFSNLWIFAPKNTHGSKSGHFSTLVSPIHRKSPNKSFRWNWIKLFQTIYPSTIHTFTEKYPSTTKKKKNFCKKPLLLATFGSHCNFTWDDINKGTAYFEFDFLIMPKSNHSLICVVKNSYSAPE